MKTLGEYINESLLDDENDVLTNDDALIHNWIKNNCRIIGSYKINKGIVNVKGNVIITNKNIKSFDVQFEKVTGYFDCSHCESLTSLEGSPKEVSGDFDCSFCESLTSLEGAPEKVGIYGSFYCSFCKKLTTLKGAPEKIGRDFYCSNCPLLDLSDFYKSNIKIKGRFIC